MSLSFFNCKMGIMVIQLLEKLKRTEQVNSQKTLGTVAFQYVLASISIVITITI